MVRPHAIVKEAHDGGDGTVLYHCPFCGSGALVARSDNSCECQSCMTNFTVQVQPQYPFSPQTIGGAPIDAPGMPGNPNDQQLQMGDFNQAPEDGMDEGMPFGDEEVPEDESGEEPDFGDEDEEAPEDSAAEGDKDENPFAKKSYLTASGKFLTEDQFVRHLAIANTPMESLPVMYERLRLEILKGLRW